MTNAAFEALAWTRHFPNPSIDSGEGENEVRPFFALEGFGEIPAVDRMKETLKGN